AGALRAASLRGCRGVERHAGRERVADGDAARALWARVHDLEGVGQLLADKDGVGLVRLGAREVGGRGPRGGGARGGGGRGWAGGAGSGASVLVSGRSAAGFTVVSALAVLSEGSGSGMSELTLAWLVTEPVFCGRTLMSTVPSWPEPSVPSAQLTVPLD